MTRDSNMMGYFNVALTIKEANMLIYRIVSTGQTLSNLNLITELNQSIHEERVKISDHIMSELERL